MSARTVKRDDRVYVSHSTPWSGRVGTVVSDEVDSLGRVRVLLDGDDDGTGNNWVAIEAEFLIPSFDVEEILGDPADTSGGSVTERRQEMLIQKIRTVLYHRPYADLGWRPDPGRFETDDAASEHLARMIAEVIA
jgi:hypothetical protein